MKLDLSTDCQKTPLLLAATILVLGGLFTLAYFSTAEAASTTESSVENEILLQKYSELDATPYTSDFEYDMLLNEYEKLDKKAGLLLDTEADQEEILQTNSLSMGGGGEICQCDANVNQTNGVDHDDLNIVIECRGAPATGTCELADVNCDGVIDDMDSTAVDLQMNGATPAVSCNFDCTIDSECTDSEVCTTGNVCLGETPTLRWAGAVSDDINVITPEAGLDAPDGTTAGFGFAGADPTATYDQFGLIDSTIHNAADLADLLGVSLELIARADFLTFEHNGDAGAGYESGTWTFSDAATGVTVVTHTQGGALPGEILAAGAVSTATYANFFGFSDPWGSGDVPYLLFDFVDPPAAIDAATFTVTLEAVGTGGSDSPDPDAMALIADGPEAPAPGDDTCDGGSNDGASCSGDADCPGGVCGLKSRFISITPGTVAGRGVPSTHFSIEVTLLDIDDALGQDAVEGQIWWAGPSQPLSNDPHPDLVGAPLVCESAPSHAEQWPSDVVHLFGAAIVPGSTYQIRMCDPGGLACSAPLIIETGQWGDVVAPFGGASQPNFADITALVRKYGSLASATDMPRADLLSAAGQAVDFKVNFADINAGVSAFKGSFYSATITPCP